MIILFPLTFLSNAPVPMRTLPGILQASVIVAVFLPLTVRAYILKA